MSGIRTVANISAADPLRPVETYIVSSSTVGSGSGAVFSVAIDSEGAASVVVVDAGNGYSTNDSITIVDEYIGSRGGVSLTFDVDEVW